MKVMRPVTGAEVATCQPGEGDVSAGPMMEARTIRSLFPMARSLLVLLLLKVDARDLLLDEERDTQDTIGPFPG